MSILDASRGALSTSGVSVLYPWFIGRSQPMSIMALQKYNKSSQLFRAKQRTKNIITSYKENLNFSNIECYDIIHSKEV